MKKYYSFKPQHILAFVCLIMIEISSLHASNPVLRLKTVNNANSYQDETIIYIHPSSTFVGNDPYDSPKMFGSPDVPQLYSVIPGKNLSINSIPYYTNTTTVDINFQAGLNGSFTFSATQLNTISDTCKLFLLDSLTQTWYNLRKDSIFTFQANTSDPYNRFKLVFGFPALDLSYLMELKNDSLIAPNEFLFDVFIKGGIYPFQLKDFQADIKLNPQILNGGVLVPEVIAGFSDLNVANQITTSNLLISGIGADYSLKISSQPSALSNATSITTQEFRVCRIKLKNQMSTSNTAAVPFASNTQFNPVWNFTNSSNNTKVIAYIPASLEITNPPSHTTSNFTNAKLNDTIPSFILSGGLSYCSTSSGSSITVSNTILGIQYQLKKNNLPLQQPITGNSGIITWNNLTSGTYTVTAYKNGSYLTTTSSNALIISEIQSITTAPQIFYGDSVLCRKDTTIIFSASYPANTDLLNWSYSGTGATFIPGNFNTSVYFSNIATSGVVTVYGSNLCGNGPSTTYPVNFYTLPAQAGIIQGLDSVCEGASNVVFTIPNIFNATSYEWTLPNEFSGSSTTNSINCSVAQPSSPASISVKGKNVCGFGAASYKNIIIKYLPPQPTAISGLDTICRGSVNIPYSTDPISGATAYQWNFSGNNVIINPGSNMVTLTFPNNATSGNLKVRAQNNCGFGVYSTAKYIYVDPCGSVEKTNEIQFTIFPNPNQGVFEILLPEAIQNAEYQVQDVNGKIYYHEQLLNPVSSLNFDLKGLPAGMYSIRIIQAGSTSNRKFIITK